MATLEQRREAIRLAAEKVRNGPLPYRTAKTVTLRRRRRKSA